MKGTHKKEERKADGCPHPGKDSDRLGETAARLGSRKGKYVITCISPRDGGILYYQDRKVDRKTFWTADEENAYRFATQTAADGYCKRLRYNHPRVREISQGT